jgi:hypothetical protein
MRADDPDPAQAAIAAEPPNKAHHQQTATQLPQPSMTALW